VNALANDKVANYLNERFVSAYQKVGTFRVVNGQKQGGNVASYFCRPNGTVLHAVAGPVNADTLLAEARWAVELNKAAFANSTNLATGSIDELKYRMTVKQAHADRYLLETNPGLAEESLRGMPRPLTGPDWAYRRGAMPFAVTMPPMSPHGASNRAKVHWLLHAETVPNKSLPLLARVSRAVWEDVLGERFSSLPVLER
jgi:hypothetical protein